MIVAEKKRPIGRPRTTLDKLPKNWEEIMEEVGMRGGSKVEAMVELGIWESAWRTLMEDEPLFQRAEKRRKALCRVWWEKRGREMAGGADGNATVWIFNMKNRFGWRDKTDHSSSDGSMSPKPTTVNVVGRKSRVKVDG